MSSASSRARWSAHPRRLGILLLSSFALTVASFVIATWVSDARSRGILDAARSIVTNSVPAMTDLADARTALRDIDTNLEVLVERSGRAPLASSAVKESLHRLEREVDAYTSLPPFAGERAHWPGMITAKDEFDASVERMLDVLDSGDVARGRAIYVDALRPAHTRLDEELSDLEALNATIAIAEAESVGDLRRQSRRWVVVLDAVSAVFAAIAALAAVRLVGRYSRVMQRRVDELEKFAGRVAHDVRSPLSAVGLALGIVERSPELDPKLRETLARGSRGLGRVGQLVDGLLVFARAGASPKEPSHADVTAVIRGVLEDLLPAAREKDIEVVVEPGDAKYVACSAGVLTSLIVNLVGNAIKYIDDAPIRRVVVRVGDRGDRVRIEVLDTGPGISSRRQESIFDPYVRGPEAGISGLGLGLATVRRLVEAHDGTVGVQSRDGSGSIFWFELPRAEPSGDP